MGLQMQIFEKYRSEAWKKIQQYIKIFSCHNCTDEPQEHRGDVKIKDA